MSVSMFTKSVQWRQLERKCLLSCMSRKIATLTSFFSLVTFLSGLEILMKIGFLLQTVELA